MMLHNMPVLSNIFIAMEPFGAFGAFRLLAGPHAVTQGFVLFQMDTNIIFLYLVMRTKKAQVYNTAL